MAGEYERKKEGATGHAGPEESKQAAGKKLRHEGAFSPRSNKWAKTIVRTERERPLTHMSQTRMPLDIIQYSGWAPFCRRCPKPTCPKHTAHPTLSGNNNRVAPTRSFVSGGHASARVQDAFALRPRLCQQPSGVRGRFSLPSYLEKRQQQQQLRPPAHPMVYPSCLLDLLTTIHFTHVLPHVLLANNQI